MEFRVLGPIQLWSAGQPQDLGSPRERSLLVMLLLTPQVIVPAETLINQLWDKRPPPKARQSLSVYIARLRASLRHAVGDHVQLVGRAQGGYLIDVDPELVDVHRFRRLRRQAAALAASGVFEHAAELLHDADDLWRGEALAGIPGAWVGRIRDAMAEEHRGAIIERIGYDFELGRHADLLGELGHLLARYPLDEALTACQMTALYRTGRQADALALYRETRGRLIEQQGAEPGPMLSELHQRMLTSDPGLASKPARRYAVQVPAPDNLPAETPGFVGRDQELRLLAGEHSSEPWIAVIEGMPGVGKTTLAVRAARLAARQYPDGTLFLGFHSHDPANPTLDAAEALHQLLRMVSVPAALIPTSIDARTALWQAHLSRRRAVIILDDVAGYDQIRPLIPVTGRCLMLITSRRRIRDLSGAHNLTLDVLSAHEAVTLFRWIAGQSKAMDEDQVAATVSVCGRLPLAIQLTAGRIAQAAPPEPDEFTEERPRSLALPGGTGAASPEVIAVFELSYRALAPGHQRVFRRLSLSPCATHSPAAAAALGDCSLAEAEKALGTLLDCHLLTPVAAGQFRFHDLIRGYANECALRDDSQAERRQAVGRLLDCYLLMADRADQILHPFRRRPDMQNPDRFPDVPALATQDGAARWLKSEWRNILQAAGYAGRHEWKRACADLSYVLAEFLEISAYWDEAIAAHTAALQASRYVTDPVRTAHALLALSAVRQQIGRHDAAIPLAEEAAAICRSLGDLPGEGESLVRIGLGHQRTARPSEALAYYREAQVLYEAAADPRGVASTLMYAGIACWHLGRRPEAGSSLRDALALYRAVGDRRGEGKALYNLGKVHLQGGRHQEALDAYRQALQIFRDIGGPQNEAIVCQGIGSVHRAEGSHEEALSAYRRALAIYRDIGDLPDEADALNDIGSLYQSAGCSDEALIHHEKASLIASDIGDPSQQLIAQRLIADIRHGSGRNGEALGHYQSALKLAREIGDLYEEGKALEGIADLTLCTQGRDDARIVWRQALDIFERLGVPEAESVRTRIRATDPGRGHDRAVNARA
jgi:DNA-binding SARP family transcriptional activator/tetratricopeptide (TPR) repeat protein